MRTHIRILAFLLAVLAAGPAFAQSLVGSVTGAVKDEQGGALPGVAITLTGKTGSRTATSEADGSYRFVGVDPGAYTLQAQITGFQAQKQSVNVNVGKEVSADFSLKVGGMTESLEVVGDAPVVNVTSSSTDNSLSQDLLFNLPIRPTNAATQLLNYAPGINSGSAYGADGNTANGLLIDGVDTRDPEGGSAWTFFNYNIVEEVQIQGLGAPAEYGAFTGAVINTITRSGGNQWAGLFDVIYSKDSLSSDNTTSEITAQNASLGQPAITNKLLDFTTQLSGPIIKDKLFFFASAQRYKLTQDPAGPRTIRDEVSPRLNLKLNYQPGGNDFFTATLQADDYNIIGRPPGGLELVVDDAITNREDAPEIVWLTQWRHLFGSKTFAEVKYTGWTGYFDLNPEVNLPGHSDNHGSYTVSQGWYAYYDRARHQVNATLSHYAEGFGKHDLKFGVEIERSKVRNRYGYVDGIIFYDYDYGDGPQPYAAYSYGYDLEGRNQRESFFAQDSWKVNDRLTLNPGVRFDWVRGTAPQLNNEKVYDTKNISPRFGFAFDLTGDRKTVLKGSYSQYYEGAFFLTFSGAVPGIGDFVTFDASGCPSVSNCPKSALVEVDRSPSKLYRVDPDIKHPRVDEFTFGIERALTRDVRFSVTGIAREDKNLQGSVIPSARWEPVTVANGLTGGNITVFRWTNPDASESDLLITNPDGFQYFDASGRSLGTVAANRKYRGLMFVLDKRLNDRWLGRLSYVLSKAEGTVENDGFDSYGVNSNFESPSRALVNADGPLRNDRRHELKLMLGVQIPVVEVGLNGYFRSVSGQTYTPFQQFGTSVINFVSTGRRARLEPRGSRRNETENLVDLRLEKIFRFSGRKDRIAVYADISNALNSSRISNVIERYPVQTIAGVGDVDFGAPASLTAPRQIQVGARWSF
jgi:outer membrane receptor protein involved in Fe transport